MMVCVQGMHEHAEFWLYELEPTAFVADIVTKGYGCHLCGCLTLSAN